MNNETIRELEKTESLISKLDNWIEEGEYETSSLSKAQLSLNKVADKLLGDNLTDKNFYVIYECQALIHWLSGEEGEALDLINSAVSLKGDRELRSINGRALASRLSSDEQYGGLKGWQALLIADALFIIVLVSGTGLISAAANMAGFVAMIIAIVVGIINISKKRTNALGLDIAMTFVGVVVLCVVMASIGGSV